MQIEKHIENKIVKGWNQMINDFTPKPNSAASGVETTIDGNSSQVKHQSRNIESILTPQPESLRRVQTNTFQYLPYIGSRCRATVNRLIYT